jgi:Arylsulfotransferase (ASST)
MRCGRVVGMGLLAAVLVAATAGGGDAHASGCTIHARRFRTHHEFGAVRYCVAHRAERSTTRGNLFFALWKSSGNPNALMILTRDGRLVWYRTAPTGVRDLKVVRYRGRRMLAYFEWGTRAYSLLDDRYREVGRIRTAPYLTDMHELQLTSHGTAYVGSYHNRRLDGSGTFIRDYTLQEVDIATGKRLFSWTAGDHVRLSDSYEPRHNRHKPWDFFHGNSIAPPTPDDPTIIVSARNTSSVYGIDRRSGRIRWILGGKRDQFGLRRHPGWRFCGQHDVRRANGGITLFDNGTRSGCPTHAARALRFRLHPGSRRAELVHSLSSATVEGIGYYPWGLGSARSLPGGHTLVSWGSVPRVTEQTSSGHVVFDVRLRSNTYRAVRSVWYGRPAEPPLAVARHRGGGTDVWASWNGATNVHSWRVLAGPAPDRLRRVQPRARWADLETTIHLRTRPAYVAVRALNAAGHILGASAPRKAR